MPTPEEVKLYHKQLRELDQDNPGGANIILDVGPDADWAHPVPEHLDGPTEEDLRRLQEALDVEPTGPEPPPVER